MPEYLAYFRPDRGGRIFRHEHFTAKDDEAAMIEAAKMQGNHAIDVMCGTREVGKLAGVRGASG